MTDTLKSWRWLAFALSLQLLFVFAVPVIADEAYFVNWGHHLSLGYYDHPPMTGWVASIFAGSVHADLLLRLGMVGLGLAMFALVDAQAREFRNPTQARVLALAWLLLPINLITFSMYLNDTLAHVFTVVFVVCVYRSRRDFQSRAASGLGWSVLAGLALGLALLTKYIIATYLIAVMVVLLLDWRGNLGFLLRRLPIVALVSAALFAINLYWNYQHCQINLAFNFLNRQGGPPQRGLFEFSVSLLVLLGPLLLFWLYRIARHAPVWPHGNPAASGFFLKLFIASVMVTLVIAFWRGQFGTHWGVALSFLAVMAFAEHRDSELPRRLLPVHAGYAGLVIGGLLLAVLAIRTDTHFLGAAKWQKLTRQFDFYSDVVSGRLRDELQHDFPKAQVVSESYGFVAMLDNHGIDSKVLFSMSKYGRNDDIFQDYAALDGRQLLILDVGLKYDADKFRPYFTRLQSVEVVVGDHHFPALLGQSFRYEAYRTSYIEPAIQKYYAQARPFSAACYMDKYD